jgi:hypothetical protein
MDPIFILRGRVGLICLLLLLSNRSAILGTSFWRLGGILLGIILEVILDYHRVKNQI